MLRLPSSDYGRGALSGLLGSIGIVLAWRYGGPLAAVLATGWALDRVQMMERVRQQDEEFGTLSEISEQQGVEIEQQAGDLRQWEELRDCEVQSLRVGGAEEPEGD